MRSSHRGSLARLRAFTLVELIVVILVLGLLAGIAVVGYSVVTTRAQDAAMRSQLHALATAIVTNAALDGDGLIDRDDVREALLTASPNLIDGLQAAAEWKLGYETDTPTGSGELAVGFTYDFVNVDRLAGTSAALVAASDSGNLFAVQMSSAVGTGNGDGNGNGNGKGNGDENGNGHLPADGSGNNGNGGSNSGSGNSNAGGNCAHSQSPKCTNVISPPAPVEGGTTPGEVLTGDEQEIPEPTPTSTPTPTPTPEVIKPLTIEFTDLTYGASGGTLTPSVTGGKGTKTFTVDRPLPAGVTLDPTTGALTTTGEAASTVGSITQADVGDNHTLLVSGGAAYAYGGGLNGQLGHGASDAASVPVPVLTAGTPMADKTITQVSAGTAHSVALASDGTVYTWGLNSNGQLGDNTTTTRRSPVAVATAGTPMAGKTITQVSAGAGYTVALASDGTIFTWGVGTYGRLGNGTTTQSLVPVAVKVTGTPMAGKTITQISAGANHVLALASDGTAYSWGRSLALGSGTGDSTVPVAVVTSGALAGKTLKQVSAGSDFSIALGTDNRVYVWGTNVYYVLGDGTTTTRSLPVQLAATFDGKTVTSLEAGVYVSTAVTSDGSLYVWGQDSNNGLGLGFGPEAQARVPTRHTTGLLADANLIAASAGNNNTFALTADGRAFRWGSISGESMAVQDKPIAVRTSSPLNGRTVVDADTSGTLQIAVDSQGRLYRWGSLAVTSTAWSTELYGDPAIPQTLPTAGTVLDGKRFTQVAAADGTGFALASDGTLYAFGSNTEGLLGTGNTTAQAKPVQIGPGTALEGKRVVEIAARGRHAAALTDEGKVYGWGLNTAGQIGDGTTTARYAPVPVVTAGTPMDGKTIVHLALGAEHSLVLASDSTMYSWGQGTYGRLGNGALTQQTRPVAVVSTNKLAGVEISQIAAGALGSMALSADGRVFAWGAKTSMAQSQPWQMALTGPAAGKTMTAIAAGGNLGNLRSHYLMVDTDGVVYGWGNNDWGQVGDGTTTVRDTPVAVGTGSSLAGKSVTALIAGGDVSMALAGDGQLHTWGEGQNEALGNGWMTGNRVLPGTLYAGLGAGSARFPFTVNVTVTDESGAASTGSLTFTLS